MIKIAIADDHPLVINGLHHILGNCADMEVMGSYANGSELLKGIAGKSAAGCTIIGYTNAGANG